MSPHRPSRRSWHSPRQNATQAASIQEEHALGLGFVWCKRFKRESVNARFKLVREFAVDEALALKPVQPFKAVRYDADMEMRLAFRSRACMTHVASAFIEDVQL